MKFISILILGLAAVMPIPPNASEVPISGEAGQEKYSCPVDMSHGAGTTERSAEDRDAIEQLMSDWSAAVANADIETIMTLVTEDCEFWSHGASSLVGPQALAEAFEPFLRKYRMKQRFDCQELVISGNWAFMRGVEVNHLTHVDGGEVEVRRQRAFSVLRRDASGRWLFARGMTNLPANPAR